MARKIVIIDVVKQPNGDFNLSCVFWLTAPANRTIQKPGATSKVPDATAGELSSLAAGTVVEQFIDSGLVPSGTSVATVKTTLQNLYNAAQTALNNTAALSNFILDNWDGSVWAF